MKIIIVILTCLLSFSFAKAQNQKTGTDSIMITIFLKHQEDKNLKEINAKLAENKFKEMFPIKEARVISWYVMMGIGQVVTLKIPASKLRDLNLTIENGAWGAFNTEFYPTYDYMPVWKEEMNKKKP
jgi:hypothetical protein